jgi:vacuolar-type H+-ATPase subunit E/Vma4
MTSERIREIQEQTAYPESRSVHQALLQVWNECEQENNKQNSELLQSNKKLLEALERIIDAQYNPLKTLANLNSEIANSKQLIQKTQTMKIQTAEEILDKHCPFILLTESGEENQVSILKAMHEHTAFQIEVLRERLKDEATTVLDFKGNSCFKDKLTIDQLINQFLKELSDAKR